jgi:type VI secretion system protein VasD
MTGFGITRALARRHLLLMALPVLASLSACGGSSKPTPTAFTISVEANSGVNPNADGTPSPVVVRIYELKSTGTFNSAEFFDLYDNDVAKLGGDMLGKREYEMKPGQKEQYVFDGSPDTKTIGVIAAYRSLDRAKWRSTLDVEPGSSNKLNVVVNVLAVTVEKAKSGWFSWF